MNRKPDRENAIEVITQMAEAITREQLWYDDVRKMWRESLGKQTPESRRINDLVREGANQRQTRADELRSLANAYPSIAADLRQIANVLITSADPVADKLLLLLGAHGSSEAKDDSYVPVSTLWSERFPGQRYRSKNAVAFLQEHKIRYRKPRKNRLEIHAADWQRYWANADSKAFEGLDGEESKTLTQDSVETPLFLENAAKMYGKIHETKRDRQ